MLIGAHVKTTGGVDKAVDRAIDIGAECMQIFAASPRMWRVTPIKDKPLENYRAKMAESGLGPTIVHAKYLTALGSPNPELVEKSRKSLAEELTQTERLGALGLVFHPASHRGAGLDAVFQQFVEGVNIVLDAAPGDALLMLETSAGSGDHIGSKFEELGRLIKAIDNPRVATCFDTQHVWASGYNIVDKDGLDETMDEFDREIGLDHLRCVHANDSMRERGSSVDRHDNIGEGLIGRDGFMNILAHPAFADVPFYLEVPGFEKDGPDKPNVDALKAIREEVSS
ncbi:MAG: deoxyribonuclease IV [Chloroflexi bacterium]|nr:deoxyribonuclease IV [Chloroflexota bacterium]